MGELTDRMEDLGLIQEDECPSFGVACQTCKKFFYCQHHWGTGEEWSD